MYTTYFQLVYIKNLHIWGEEGGDRKEASVAKCYQLVTSRRILCIFLVTFLKWQNYF